MLRNAIFPILLLLFISPIFQQVHAVKVASNIDIAGETSPDRQRVEPTIAIDPRNPQIIVAGAQDLRLISVGEHRWHGYYRSTDSGQTWSSTLLPGFPGDSSPLGLASPLHGFNTTSDPVLAFDRAGNVFYTGIAFNIHSGSIVLPLVAFVAKFTNDGASYAGATVIKGQNLTDKPWIVVDTTGGVNAGNVYLIFKGCCTSHGKFTTVFTRSTDGGATFSNPIPVTEMFSFPTGLTVDPAGNVLVASESSVGRNSIDILVTKSTNGGLGFQAPVVAVTRASPLPGTLPGNGFRTPTLPQIAADSKGVYLVWDEFVNQANVHFARSTDDGATWSSALTVNDVTIGEHFFPTIAVSNGIISVAWYDSRLNKSGNDTITALDVFYANSVDAGASFSKNVRVTSASFNPNIVERTDTGGIGTSPTTPFMGDYIEIAASGTVVHPIWTDNRSACDTVDPTFGCVDQDAFTTTITL